jgi:hypothetical protein
VLSKDLEAGGGVAAKAGSKVTGQVTYTAAPSAAGAIDAMHLSLESVQLKIGETEVPLRSTVRKTGVGVLEYHWLEDTGRIALVLYVAKDVTLAPAR